MGKLTKTLAAVAAVLVVILAVAAVAVRVLLPPAKIKALAIERADKALHRKLELQSVEIGLFSGLSIRGLRLSETPDFSRGEFLKADSLTVRPRWLPLLRKKIEIGSLELDGASVTIAKDKAGRFNFAESSTAKPSGAKPSSAATPAALPAVEVGSLRLRQVKLSYLDRQQPAKADVTIDDASFQDLRLSGPVSLSVSARADYSGGGRKLAAAFKAKGSVDLAGGDVSRAGADLSRISLALGGKEITGSLKLSADQASKLVARLSVPELGAETVNAALGPGTLSPGTTLPPIEASLEAAYSAPKLEVTSLKASAAGLQLSATASASLLGETLKLESLVAKLGGLEAKLSGTIGGLHAKTQALDLRLQTNAFELGSLAADVAALKPLGLTGKSSLSASISGTVATPRVSGSLSLDGVGADYQGQRLEKVAGQARFTEKSVDLPQLTGRFNGGDFRLKIAASGGAAPSASVSGSLSLLDLGALQKLASAAPAAGGAPKTAAKPAAAPATSPPLRTTGGITVDRITHPNFECGKASLSWNLSGVTPDMRRIAGSARLMSGPGRAKGLLDYAAAEGGMVRAVVLPLQAAQKARGLHIPGVNIPDMQNVPFDKIEGVFAASNGILSMQPLSLTGPTIGMATTGTVDLAAQTANLKSTVRVSGQQFGLTITGPVADPSVRPDLSQLLQTGKKLLQQNGQQLLKQLFHR